MYQKVVRIGISSLGVFLLGATISLAAPQDPAKPDNTKVNQRDRKAGSPTADQQKENTPDREIAAKIRRAIMADKSLSMGPLREAERDRERYRHGRNIYRWPLVH